MSGDINSYFSNIGSQTVNNFSAKDNQQNIDLLKKMEKLITEDSKITREVCVKCIKEIEALRHELSEVKPNPQRIERALGVLGSVASIASLVTSFSPPS